MKLRIITKASRIFNVITIACLTFGIVTVVISESIKSENQIIIFFKSFAIVALAIGLLLLVLGFFISSHKEITSNNIKGLHINSNRSIEDIKSVDEIEYLGNFVLMQKGIKIEVHQNQILELLDIAYSNEIPVTVKYTPTRFYLQSPKEIFKYLLNFGV